METTKTYQKIKEELNEMNIKMFNYLLDLIRSNKRVYSQNQLSELLDRNGIALFEGAKFRFTAPDDINVINFQSEIIFSKKHAAYGYLFTNGITEMHFIPLCDWHELDEDFLRNIEITNNVSYD